MALYYYEQGRYRCFHLILWDHVQSFSCTPQGTVRIHLTSSDVIGFQVASEEERDAIAERCESLFAVERPQQPQCISVSYRDSCGGRFAVRDVIAVSGYSNRRVIFFPRQGGPIKMEVASEAEIWTVMQRCFAEVKKLQAATPAPKFILSYGPQDSDPGDSDPGDSETWPDCPMTPFQDVSFDYDDEEVAQICQRGGNMCFFPEIQYDNMLVEPHTTNKECVL